ncbi:vitamin B6 photo-protection and homoeostasis-domain-containing protein [Bisporella sp. PMI_857]|nr:vitamin B6 photo-protection and homoeostasis-domain-containing protein [Bisporella sp. PMI_857]
MAGTYATKEDKLPESRLSKFQLLELDDAHNPVARYIRDKNRTVIKAFSSAIAGLLASRAVLQGIGVGDSQASPTAALLLSVLQDNVGRIATILFAHRLGTALEPECKMYRLAADVFNDAAMVFDCLSPALPRTYRVVLLSASSVLRSLCGVAAGSAKASLSAHFATQGNLGELNAKDSSQETVISLIGNLVGSYVVSHISSRKWTWIALIFLLTIHLRTNYLAVRAVSMRTLNRQRANLLFSTYIGESIQRSDLQSRSFPGPEEVSKKERIFEFDGVLRWKGDKVIGCCEIGVPLSRILDLVSRSTDSDKSYEEIFERLLEDFSHDDYIIWYDRYSKRFLIVLKGSSTTITQLHAWMHVLWLAHRLSSELKESKDQLSIISQTRESISWITPQFLEKELRKMGWDTELGALETKSGTRLAKEEDIDTSVKSKLA